MDTMTEPLSTTDKRVDDLRSETHRGFNLLDADIREVRSDLREVRSEVREIRSEVREVRSEVRSEIGEVRSDISSLQRLMIGFFATTLGSIVAGTVVTVLMSHH